MKGSENVETYDEYSGVFRYMLVYAECAVGEECVFLTLYVLYLTLHVLNIHIYLQFMSFLHNDMTRVVEILLKVKQGHTYSK